MTANCTRCSGLESTFAPTSSSTETPPLAFGNGAAKATRSTDSSVPRTNREVVITAPVLPAECLSRVILHGDHLACRNNLDQSGRSRMPGQLRANEIRLAHQQHANAELLCRQYTPLHLRTGCVVSPHGSDSDGDHGITLLTALTCSGRREPAPFYPSRDGAP